MKQFDYTLNLKMGIHARPAALIADRARLVDADVRVSFGEKTADACNILELTGLRTRKDDVVTVSVEGGDEEAVLAEMEQLFRENF